MRKRIAIAGHSDEGLGLIPLLEANPDVEICAILSDDREAAMRALSRTAPALEESFADKITIDAQSVLRTPGLVAFIDCDMSGPLREILAIAPERGVQVTTPMIAKLLYAFGPVDGTRKPDLLKALSEILESYNLTVDRSGLLNRILQIAVGATGADRGSLMLYDSEIERLRVVVAIGLERELLPKIQVSPGEGIAGRAFEDRQAILVRGRADHERYRIARERSDVESAISVPLIHDDQAIGVLNLSHSQLRSAFREEDLDFVTKLAAVDARIIARTEEYHRLLGDSARLRAQAHVREILAGSSPLPQRLSAICKHVAGELSGGICHVYLLEPELQVLHLRGSSTSLDPLAPPIELPIDGGIHGWVARHRQPVVLSQKFEDMRACFAVLPLLGRDDLLGLLSFEGANQEEPPEILKVTMAAVAEALGSELGDALRALRLEREANRTAAMTELAARMGSARDSAELHRSITSSAAVVLDAEHSILRLHDSSTGRYQIRSYFGSAEPDSQGPLFEFEKQLSISAISSRAPVRVINVSARSDLPTQNIDVQSALIVPLIRDGRVQGTLSALGRADAHPLSGRSFLESDCNLLGRFAEHVQQALDQVQEREWSRHNLRFDELTGLPNSAHLTERIDEEIARSTGRDRVFALIRLEISGLRELLIEQRETEADRLVLSIAQELRAQLREFDIVARTAPDTFEVLIPEPGEEVSALLGPLARRAREAMRREPDPNLVDRLDLEFGYAIFPEDAQTARGIQLLAAKPRVKIEREN